MFFQTKRSIYLSKQQNVAIEQDKKKQNQTSKSQFHYEDILIYADLLL